MLKAPLEKDGGTGQFLSVIICTHNPRPDHLRRTLQSLQAQTLDRAQWELLVIDNRSDGPLDGKWDLSWQPHSKHVREERIGLTMARLRGIEESKGALLLFVDDDNVLCDDYLVRALEIMDRHPFLGVIGAGRIEAEFEKEPDPGLKPYLPMLALRSVAGSNWSNDPKDFSVPWGAGMLVRRAVAARYQDILFADPKKQRLDRSGTSLNSCGDDEFSWVACEMGLGKGIFNELYVLHLIAAFRVQQEYLLRLAEGHAFSRALLFHLHGERVRLPGPEPTLGRVLGKFASLRLSEFRWEASRWWNQPQHGSSLTRAFEKARVAGLHRFRTTVLEKP